jgi:nucleobase:cation symporter-1, NCS1 family
LPGRVGVIETRGVEPVPDADRHGGPIGLFWTWFAANLGVLGITLGAGLVTVTGLGLIPAVLAAGAGAAGSFLLVGVLSTAGTRGGAPGLTLSRAVFGVRGNRGPALVSWLGFVGWETVMCTTAAYALLALLRMAGGPAGTGALTGCVLATVALAAGLGVFGHATILWVQKWLTWVFGALTLVVAVVLAARADWPAALHRPAGSPGALVSGIGFIAAGTGLGWLSAGADYARYLPRSVRPGRIVGATVLGSVIPLVVLVSLGAVMAAGDSGLAAAGDPVAAIGAALPGWMLGPYLLTAVAGLIAAADLSMYSSGLSLITAGVRVRRAAAVGVDAVLIVAGALYVTVVARDFYGPFIAFLTLLAVPLAAWAGVVLTDRPGRTYDPEALTDLSPGGAYWYTAGVRVPALAAWLVAAVLGWLWDTRMPLGWLVAGVAAAGLSRAPAVRERSRA